MPITPQYLKNLYTGEDSPVVEWFNVGANQTIVYGDLVQINATTGLLEAATAASTTIVGMANGDITTGATVTSKDKIPVILARGSLFRLNYVGTTKTSLTQADLYTVAFDLSSKTTINLDDTTGGMCLVFRYDNVKKTADVVIKTSNIIPA